MADITGKYGYNRMSCQLIDSLTTNYITQNQAHWQAILKKILEPRFEIFYFPRKPFFTTYLIFTHQFHSFM